LKPHLVEAIYFQHSCLLGVSIQQDEYCTASPSIKISRCAITLKITIIRRY